MYDELSYSKGAAVIRMISEWLGPPVFRRGLQLYLQRHAWSSVTSDCLFAALSEASGLDVGAMAISWTRVAGFPLLTFGADGSCCQRRFLAGGGCPAPEDGAPDGAGPLWRWGGGVCGSGCAGAVGVWGGGGDGGGVGVGVGVGVGASPGVGAPRSPVQPCHPITE
jgi:hypothetical protein